MYKESPLIVKKLNDYYNDWWSDVSKEFNYTYIDIEPNHINKLTSHDIHVNSITAWHQRDVRKGVAYEIGPYSLNFKESGVYEFSLRRWPKEANLKLAETINDNYPSTKFQNIVCINVLNVVSKKIRQEIITNIKELLNDNGIAYLCVPRNIPIKGKYSGFERRPQNYVVLTLNSIYIDKSVEIYELHKNSIYEDKTINIGENN